MDKYINVAEIAFAFKEEEVAAQYGGKNDITTGVLFALDTLELDMPESIVRCKDCKHNREKLIELIQAAVNGCSTYWAGLIADHLIANGVTFATDNHVGGKWIPVTERLPDVEVDVLVVKDNGDKSMAVFRLYRTIPNGQPYWEDEVGDGLVLEAATHWMPLPEPPKEGE